MAFESALPGMKRAILVHLPDDLITRIDAKAALAGESRSVIIARLMLQALSSPVIKKFQG